MLEALKGKVDNMEEQMNNVSRKMGTLGKHPEEVLESKTS